MVKELYHDVLLLKGAKNLQLLFVPRGGKDGAGEMKGRKESEKKKKGEFAPGFLERGERRINASSNRFHQH